MLVPDENGSMRHGRTSPFGFQFFGKASASDGASLALRPPCDQAKRSPAVELHLRPPAPGTACQPAIALSGRACRTPTGRTYPVRTSVRGPRVVVEARTAPGTPDL